MPVVGRPWNIVAPDRIANELYIRDTKGRVACRIGTDFFTEDVEIEL